MYDLSRVYAPPGPDKLDILVAEKRGLSMKSAPFLPSCRCSAVARLVLIATILIFIGCTRVSPPNRSAKPSRWAIPVSATPGLPNLHRVNATLYRSAQPTRDGFAFLSRRPHLWNDDPPIKTVLSLRSAHDDALLVPADFPLRLEQIRFNTQHPENEDVVKFLRIVTTPSLQPVLVHCKHGSDRTGTMIAVYRVIVEGWSKDEALREMTEGGFGFHPVWQNLIRYIMKLDVNEIKAEVDGRGTWRQTA